MQELTQREEQTTGFAVFWQELRACHPSLVAKWCLLVVLVPPATDGCWQSTMLSRPVKPPWAQPLWCTALWCFWKVRPGQRYYAELIIRVKRHRFCCPQVLCLSHWWCWCPVRDPANTLRWGEFLGSWGAAWTSEQLRKPSFLETFPVAPVLYVIELKWNLYWHSCNQ